MYVYYKIPGRAISKKNSMQMAFNKATGKTFPVQSAAWRKYEREAKKHLKPLHPPINEPVNITVTYWVHKNKDGSIPKQKLDLLNLLAGTDDLLVKYEILKDDNCQILVGHDGSRVIYTDYANEEYATVEITSL